MSYQQINGHYISWQHLVDLYNLGKGSCREAPGLNMLHKLKKEHITLTSYSKMKVNLSGKIIYLHEWIIHILCFFVHYLLGSQ